MSDLELNEFSAQADAGASQTITLLAKDSVSTKGEPASISLIQCSGCGTCVSVCQYSAPRFIEEGEFKGKSEIDASLCEGCGVCVPSCRSSAITLKGFSDEQILSMIDTVL